MGLLSRLFNEKCPQCQKTLETNKSNIYKGIIIKSCPNLHYQKEYHPALELYVESGKVS
ncbi:MULTISPECIES: hypothetical protein [Cytobacillus]|uniref:hypothetical protein n=1 Tax=Cytobacillus TaxID=2675230 RepID=UPI000A9A2195|nr:MULTISPECIES: hypothetical protein [Cytobacillus]KAF0815686.1 hypothetical protein KIS4809_5521 [Bacillus sp. ZZV12-4809]MCM3094226.1 hypothetical protein [Cytobacillus sp. AMY 15.2]MEC1895258.1 hypothetical protein [Cytobacillus firmus]MED1938766.1 hypothetical protein [Cytobacillus firmus]MED4768173.1 hypothetical protein [Cytobacillus firmus]